MRHIFSALCLMLCLCVAPQQLQATSDIALTVTLTNGNYLPKGQSATAKITLTNLGPDSTNLLSVGTSYWQEDTIAVFSVPETAPCLIGYLDLNADGRKTFISSTVSFYDGNNTRATLQSGESVTCTIGIYVFPNAPDFIDQLFVASGYIGDNDPIKSNNLFNLHIKTSLEPKKVPATNFGALLLLILLMPLLAFAFKKQNTT